MYNSKNKTQGVFIMTKKTNSNGIRRQMQIDPNKITEYGIKIVMDEEKILREDIYDLDEMYKVIDDIAIYAEMKKIDKYYYVSMNNSPVDLGCFIFTNLEEKEWFINNVSEVIWYDKDDGIHDILNFMKEKNTK